MGLVWLRGEAAIQIHRQVLVEHDRYVAGASLHFARGPTRDAGNLRSGKLLKFRYQAIVEGNFLKPGAALSKVGRQLVAQVHQAAKVPGANCRSVDSGAQLQGIRYRLVRGAYPDGSPLRYGEAYQRET